MARRTLGTYFNDFDRLADSIHSLYGDNIDDDATFRVAFDNYMLPDKAGNRGVKISNEIFGRDSFKEKTQKIYKNKFGLTKSKISDDKALHKLGGGKNLKRDRLRTAKTVFPNTIRGRRRFADTGATETDISGIDTKSGKRIKKITPVKHDFEVIGRQKKKITKARQTTIKIKGKKIRKLRDRKGRFVAKT